MHPHLLVLGFAVFLIATLFALQDDFTGDKLFKTILHRVQRWPGRHRVHDAGCAASVGSRRRAACDARSPAISGIAGIGHILIGVGLVLLTVMFKRVVNRKLAGNARLRARLRDRPPRSPPTRCWRASSFWLPSKDAALSQDRSRPAHVPETGSAPKPHARSAGTRGKCRPAARRRPRQLLSRPLPACASSSARLWTSRFSRKYGAHGFSPLPAR